MTSLAVVDSAPETIEQAKKPTTAIAEGKCDEPGIDGMILVSVRDKNSKLKLDEYDR